MRSPFVGACLDARSGASAPFKRVERFPQRVCGRCVYLGAGKTAFTRGLARGLGCTDIVTSPTYTIVNEYLGGRLPLFHFDMYRLASSDDLWDIGWEDYLDRNGICAVEWSENVDDAMEDALYITIEKLGEETRRITIEGGEFLADLSL